MLYPHSRTICAKKNEDVPAKILIFNYGENFGSELLENEKSFPQIFIFQELYIFPSPNYVRFSVMDLSMH